jgi:hypothetical protein
MNLFPIKFQEIRNSISLLVSSTSLTTGVVRTHNLRDGLTVNTFRLAVRNSISLPGEKAYDRPLPLNDNEAAELKKVKQYIPEENKEFCSEMLQWPMTDSSRG